jgi:hypothetical protein
MVLGFCDGNNKSVVIFREPSSARQLDDEFRRQDRADIIGLRRGVNFVEMTLRFWQTHKLPDALV